MNSDYTQESLQLAITEAIYASDVALSLHEILQRLFGFDYNSNLSNTLKTFVRRQYTNQLRGYIRHFGKKYICQQLKAGSANFIKQFEQQKCLNNLFKDATQIQMRIRYLLEVNSDGNLFNEFSRYFNRLRNRFVPLQAEENFRLALIEWLRSGEMTKIIRNEFNNWFETGANLCAFKNINLTSAPNRDSYKTKVLRAIEEIRTDEFMQPDDLKRILSKFLAPAKINVENEKIRLEGQTIFFSEWIDKIVKICEKNSDFDVEIYAADCCGIDCNIDLYGINLVIYSKKVYVWQVHRINLSGIAYK